MSSSAYGPGTVGDVIARAADRLILDDASIDRSIRQPRAGGGGEIQLLVGDVMDLPGRRRSDRGNIPLAPRSW
jgi:hypothetical protein